MLERERPELRRGVAEALGRAVARHPVVLVTGPAHVGKSALARAAFPTAGRYVALAEDPVARDAATADPSGFLQRLEPSTVLDDVHVVPDLLGELDQHNRRVRTPGAVVAVAPSGALFPLARAVGGLRLPTVVVSPLTRGERLGRVGRLLTACFGTDPGQWPSEALGVNDYLAVAAEGGRIDLLDVDDPAQRTRQWEHTVEGLLGALTPLEATAARRVLGLAVQRPAGAVNVDRDAAELRLRPNDVAAALHLLEGLGLVRLSPAWTRFRRGDDNVRVYARDSGSLPALLTAAGGGAGAGAVVPPPLALRTLAAQELYAQNEWARHPVTISYWRSKPSQYDIDFLLEDANGSVVAIAVSGSVAPGVGDFAGIDAFRRRHPRAYRRGLLLYPGDRIRALPDARWAVPLSVLWTVADQAAPLDVASLDTELAAAASALKLLVDRVTVADAGLADRRSALAATMRNSLGPRLERIALVLGSLGLGVTPVGPAAAPAAPDDPAEPGWFGGLRSALDAEGTGPLTVVSGLEIRTADAAGVQWVAFVCATAGAHQPVQWRAGHAVLAGRSDDGTFLAPPTLVGLAGPLASEGTDAEEALLEQLCASLAASLPDALAALAASV